MQKILPKFARKTCMRQTSAPYKFLSIKLPWT